MSKDNLIPSIHGARCQMVPMAVDEEESMDGELFPGNSSKLHEEFLEEYKHLKGQFERA